MSAIKRMGVNSLISITRCSGPGIKPIQYRIVVSSLGIAKPVRVVRSSDSDEILTVLIQEMGLRWPYQKPVERPSA